MYVFVSVIVVDCIFSINLFLEKKKITSANLCKPIHDIKNYATFTCPFESGKYWKEEKNLQKVEYLDNKKSFLDEIKSIFQCLKGYHLEDTSFNIYHNFLKKITHTCQTKGQLLRSNNSCIRWDHGTKIQTGNNM